MKMPDDTPSTNPAEIEALIVRLKQSNLDHSDALLLERLLRLLLSLITLLQHKNASISRLKRWLFGPRSDSRSKPSDKPLSDTSDQLSASCSQTDSPSSDPTPQSKPGHGRRPARDFNGAKVVDCTDPLLKVGSPCPDRACRGH